MATIRQTTEALCRSASHSWYKRCCIHGDTDGVLQLLLDNVAKECCPGGHDWQILRQVSPTQSHHCNGAAEKAVSTVRGLARTFLAVIKDKILFLAVTTHSPMLPWTIDHTRSMDSHEIRSEKGHTNDSVREDTRTERQKRDSSTGQSASATMGNGPLAH